MNKINMAPRAHGRSGTPDYKIMTCSGCEQEVLVQSGFSSNEMVYCMECAQTIILNSGKGGVPGSDSLNSSQTLSPQDISSLRLIWYFLDNSSFNKAEIALSALSQEHCYVKNAWGVCY